MLMFYTCDRRIYEVRGLNNLLKERIEKANPRRQLIVEEIKRQGKLKVIANRSKRGGNVQNL
jgi:hypothetical protein